jgi:hypothetical protein
MTSETHSRCPLCGDQLGRVGAKYMCWNSGCDFSSYRPWITPPRAKNCVPLSQHDTKVIGECLNATAQGPFFVDRGNVKDPYWEFSALFGFQQPEVAAISSQWPDVDYRDEFVEDLVSRCIVHLIGYPHGCERHWRDFISVSREELLALVQRLQGSANAPRI